jgi:hypothetical protein
VIDAILQSQGNVQTSNTLLIYKQMSYCSDLPPGSDSFVSANVPATGIPWYNLGQYGQGIPVSDDFYNNIAGSSSGILIKESPTVLRGSLIGIPTGLELKGGTASNSDFFRFLNWDAYEMTCPFGSNPLSSFFFDSVTFPSVSSTELGAAACIAQSLWVLASTKELDFILGENLRG